MATPEDVDAIARRALAVQVFLRNRGLTVFEAVDVLSATIALLHAEEERMAVKDEIVEKLAELIAVLSPTPR